MHKIMLTAMTLTLAAAAAVGVAPGQWHHSSEADFQSAQRDGTVVNSRGDVLLGRKIDILLASEDAPAAISAVVVRDGVVYAASGADGRIVRIDEDGKVDTFATIPAGMVTSMALRGRTLLVGGTGKKAGIYVVSPEGESQRLFADEDVTYVWDILPTDETTLFAATGPNGRVYRIDADGKGEVILDAGSLIKNILCLAASDDGDIYAGTDRKGLIYRVDPKTRRGRVILDAEEAEIAAIVPDGRGGLYAATSDATKGQGEAPTGEKTGRADTEAVVGELGDDAGDGDDDEPPLPDTPDDDGDGGDDGENAPEESDEGAVVPPVDLDAGADATVTGRPGPGEKTKPTPVAPQPPRPGGNGGAKRIRTNGRPAGGPAAAPSGKGNAVYHVDAKGFVHGIYRRPVVIHAMVVSGGRLVLATGNDGTVHYVTPDGSRSGRLVDTEAAQVACLAAEADGSVVFGTADAGSVGRIAAGFGEDGTLTSKPLDAGQIAAWGTVRLRGLAPEQTTLTIATRSGNLAEPTDATWSTWSKNMPLTDDFMPIGSPAGRFLQYRVTMTSDGRRSPSLGSVRLIYQVGNLPPVVSSLKVTPNNQGSTPQQTAPTKLYRHVEIKAADPNKDKLSFRIAYRLIGRGAWVEITEDLTEPTFVWDTRTVADGRYELHITASDEPSNVAPQAMTGSRITEPVTVDNTAPAIRNGAARRDGRNATVQGRATDALSRIVTLAYSVDSADEWHVVLPTDGICDSTDEPFSFDVEDLDVGAHQITVRAVDVYGNIGYASVEVTVPTP